jgi:energy-converting hydrogenase A subunit R
MQTLPNGGKIFEVISRYDDLLSLEAKSNYEPGDTLSLIVPFLILHKISEWDILQLANKSKLTPGAKELVDELKDDSWGIHCITTSYEQFATVITGQLTIPRWRLRCTKLELDRYLSRLTTDEFMLVQNIENTISSLKPGLDDLRIKEVLDRFYWQTAVTLELGKVINEVRPVGGRRKVEAINSFCRDTDTKLSEWVVVGDSITDSKILEAVNTQGGLSIAFNANSYALEYATVGVAANSLAYIFELLKYWILEGRNGVKEFIGSKQSSYDSDNADIYFDWISSTSNLETVQKKHQQMRTLLRTGAAKLG